MKRNWKARNSDAEKSRKSCYLSRRKYNFGKRNRIQERWRISKIAYLTWNWTVRKRRAKNEKTENKKLEIADKHSYFGQRRHLRWPKLLIRSKKSQKRLFLALFYMFFSIFEAFSGVKIYKLTMPFSLLIFGVFWEKQGLNLRHPYFLTFLRRFALHFSTILKNIF